MSSRLLQRFNAEIGRLAGMPEAAAWRAQRAAYHARVGAFERADAEIAALRSHCDSRPSMALSAWINLAEGLRSHATDLGPLARDKIRRAHAMGKAVGARPQQARCAARLAHKAYLHMEAAALAEHAGEALRLAEPEDHAARSRANLVVAQAFDEAGRPDLAKPWYERAHHHATTEGDDATLSALMWNMAMLRLRDLRQRARLGQTDTVVHHRARLSAESIARFDEGLGVTSMRALHPVLRAQLLTESGSHAQALALFSSHLDDALKQGMATITAALLADQAWCQLHRGGRGAALTGARAAEATLGLSIVPGDRAPAHGRLAQLFAALALPQDAARHQRLAESAWRDYADLQARLLSALMPLTPQGMPQAMTQAVTQAVTRETP
jgi:hypothetical protein